MDDRIYELSKRIVNLVVPKRSVGVYRLGIKRRERFWLYYFGRSDTDLRRRLAQHVKDALFSHFSFETTETIFEAYRRECREWHMGIAQAKNFIHPRVPKGLPYRCVYCMLLGIQIVR